MKYPLCLAALVAFSSSCLASELSLSSILSARDADSDLARPMADASADGSAMKINAQAFAKGIGTQVDSRLAFSLGGATRFSATVGVDDASLSGEAISFQVLIDGKEAWRKELKRGEAPAAVDLDVSGHATIELCTFDLGNAATGGLGDWADAMMIFDGEKPKAIPAPTVVEEPVVLTPEAPAKPRINGARVFGVRPGSPFLFQVPATGQRPVVYSARGLPAGLTLNTDTGLITGVVTETGSSLVTLTARNAAGEQSSPLRIVVGEAIALTPPMGWNSWNSWAGAVDQEKVLASGRAMASSGLIQHGWSYVNIDDTWQGARSGPSHSLQPNEKFPDMAALSRDLHALGLKLGIYSTPWTTSYASHAGGSSENPEGSWTKPKGPKTLNKKTMPWAIGKYSFAEADAKQWGTWGIDYLKYDWNPIEVPETAEMQKALRASGRDIIYSLSNAAPFAGAQDWARLANAWRTTGDIRDTWTSLHNIGFASQQRWQPFAGPGHWNDPDMLVVGNVGWGPKLHASHLSVNEQYTHISLWCLLSAPLLIGCPIEQMDAFTRSLLTNDEVLAVDQDEAGEEAKQVVVDGRREVWMKTMADGSHVIGLFNLAQEAQPITVDWMRLGLKGAQQVRDLWRQKDLGVQLDGFTAMVARHGVVLVRVAAVR